MGDSPNPFALTALLRLKGILLTIMWWHGSLENIPSGWQLADGTNGTQDLRNDFMRCSGPGAPPFSSGGSSTHTHTADGQIWDPHLGDAPMVAAGETYEDLLGDDAATITVSTDDHRPPYNALYPIQFVGYD